ncbi:hypothetical protein Droror1_Dr00021567 [Drosera rotundifolia]
MYIFTLHMSFFNTHVRLFPIICTDKYIFFSLQRMYVFVQHTYALLDSSDNEFVEEDGGHTRWRRWNAHVFSGLVEEVNHDADDLVRTVKDVIDCLVEEVEDDNDGVVVEAGE